MTRSVWMPVSRDCSSSRFLTSSPPPTSSAKASAISATTRPLPIWLRCRCRSGYRASRTDAASSRVRMPQQRPEAAEDADADGDHRREQQHPPVDRDGRRPRQLVAGKDDERARAARRRAARRAVPPIAARIVLSAMSCRARSPSRAPSASRIPSSRRRARPAASSRLATLAQPISSTAKTAPSSIRSCGRTAPTTTSR